ncbi:MAG: hypothetical protein RL246_2282 [Bacteroidota bacterium]|jgi:hypothetical protein
MKYLACALLFLLASCTKLGDEERLDQEKLAQILVDIHLDEAKISGMEIVSVDSNMLLFNALEKSTLKKHQIDSVTLIHSFHAYVREPKDFIKLYERVNEIMEQRKKANETSHR